VAAAAPSKNNDKQTSANIRLAQLAHRTVDNDAGVWASQRAAFIYYPRLRSSVKALELKPTKQPFFVGSHKKKLVFAMKCYNTQQKTRKEGSFRMS